MLERKGGDKSPVIRENQTDLPGFSVFELFDQLAKHYDNLMCQYPPQAPQDRRRIMRIDTG